MIECPKCNAEIEKDSRFCDQCGQEIKYCSVCGKIGKGKRCTSCGNIMISAQEKIKNNENVTSSGNHVKSIPVGEVEKTICISGTPRLFLCNNILNVKFEIKDKTIIGRKTGPYQSFFSSQPYVSGAHAQIHYDILAGWMITDLGSSNGTQLGGTKLQPNVPYTLTNGIHIHIANIEFVAELI